MENVKNFIYSWNPDVVGLIAALVGIVVFVLVMVLVIDIQKSEAIRARYTELKQQSNESLVSSMRRSKFKAFNYDDIEQHITQTGMVYMFKSWGIKLTPLKYLVIKWVSAVFLFVVGISVGGIIAAVLFAFAGFYFIDLVANMSNKSDNDKMLSDIRAIYDNLRIQSKAGVYITATLSDCYLVVKNKRLKDALLKLTSDIIAKNDIEETMENFRSNFSNEYIDTLSVIIKQSMISGQAAQLFDDIRGQLDDIRIAENLAEKKRIQNLIVLTQVLLYIGIIMVSVYVAVKALSSGLNF